MAEYRINIITSAQTSGLDQTQQATKGLTQSTRDLNAELTKANQQFRDSQNPAVAAAGASKKLGDAMGGANDKAGGLLQGLKKVGNAIPGFQFGLASLTNVWTLLALAIVGTVAKIREWDEIVQKNEARIKVFRDLNKEVDRFRENVQEAKREFVEFNREFEKATKDEATPSGEGEAAAAKAKAGFAAERTRIQLGKDLALAEIEAAEAAGLKGKGLGFGRRSDGTKKGPGFMGSLKRPDGDISTELSIGVNIDGQEMEIPTLVPTLSKPEINHLLRGGEPTGAIVDKAVDHARKRLRLGQSAFKSGPMTAGEAGEARLRVGLASEKQMGEIDLAEKKELSDIKLLVAGSERFRADEARRAFPGAQAAQVAAQNTLGDKQRALKAAMEFGGFDQEGAAVAGGRAAQIDEELKNLKVFSLTPNSAEYKRRRAALLGERASLAQGVGFARSGVEQAQLGLDEATANAAGIRATALSAGSASVSLRRQGLAEAGEFEASAALRGEGDAIRAAVAAEQSNAVALKESARLQAESAKELQQVVKSLGDGLSEIGGLRRQVDYLLNQTKTNAASQ